MVKDRRWLETQLRGLVKDAESRSPSRRAKIDKRKAEIVAAYDEALRSNPPGSQGDLFDG